MDNVLIMVGLVLIVYLVRGNIFVSKVRFKAGPKGVELEIGTKEKNDPPGKDDRSNRKK
ncbi:MAG: hypothetical protein ACRDDY_14885 [Clostridium sp.]|uniref:hypothetical protein n=1 Tax=Clostridium sp. TaxID=1506 RepID=UPI003EE61D72